MSALGSKSNPRSSPETTSNTSATSELFAGLSLAELQWIVHDWLLYARDDQLPPNWKTQDADWRVWLILGGRGAGKTRAGAEWIRAKALGHPPFTKAAAKRIALIGETLNDVRRVMIEGISGLLAIHPEGERPKFEPSKGQVVWPNGAIAQVFSAENAESLRGPQFEAAWCDETAKWRNASATWDMLQFGLRLGETPQVVVTTTPRAIPLLKRIMEDEATVITRATTQANARNLAATFVDEIERRYAGTALGRQELLGELLDDESGSLWRRDWIEQTRVRAAPELRTIVVAVDPPVTATERSDACGIVVAARGVDGRGYVLADRTVQGRDPDTWARAAIAACRDYEADRIVAEVNQGGDMVESILRQIDPRLIVRTVRATRGKWLRAEPIASLYAQGRIVHVGGFDDLEDQMSVFGVDGKSDGRSPDRLDALVWAMTDLMLSPPASPTVRVI